MKRKSKIFPWSFFGSFLLKKTQKRRKITKKLPTRKAQERAEVKENGFSFLFPLTFGYGLKVRTNLVRIKRTFLAKRYQYVSVFLVLILIAGSYLFIANPFGTKAASYQWVQNDWSGGAAVDVADHNSHQTGWGKYSTKDDLIDTSEASKVKLTQESVNIFKYDTDSDFAGGTFSGLETIGSGAEAKIGFDISSVGPFLQVSAGETFFLGLKEDGTLWSWGRNNYGQLGLGDLVNRSYPVQIGSENNWQSISAGSNHAVAIKADGTLWGWGLNTNYQLGLAATGNRSVPVQIGTDSNWGKISAGRFNQTLAIKTNGTLWAWGNNAAGQLGVGDTTQRTTPTQVGSENNWNLVSSGYYTTIAIKGDGTLWGWGMGDYGVLAGAATTSTPTQLGADNDWQTAILGGNHFVLAIKTNGTLWAWGRNNSAQLGLGDYTNRSVITQVGSDTDWQKIGAANGVGTHSLGVKTNGTLWAWGNNATGQLGLGDTTTRVSPVRVGTDSDWREVSAGSGFSAAVKSNAGISTCGDNTYGQLSLITSGTVREFTFVEINSQNTGSYISEILPISGPHGFARWESEVGGGQGLSVKIRTSSSADMTGAPDWSTCDEVVSREDISNNNCVSDADKFLQYKVDLSSASPLSTPYFKNIFLTGLGYPYVESVLLGFDEGTHTLTESSNNEELTISSEKFSVVATGLYNTFAIKTNGTLWAWGVNNIGQLGLGDTVNRLSPAQVGTDTDWASIAVGEDFLLAIKTNGTLWSLGVNTEGQLGLGDTTTRTTLTQVGTDNNWRSVAAGRKYSMAIKTNGTLWAWGYNYNYILGLGNTTVNKTSPVQVGTDTAWRSVYPGSSHTLAIKNDGTLWGWGINSSYQLGIGITSNQNAPYRVGTASDWSVASAGSGYSKGVKTDGTLWIWGDSEYASYHIPTKFGSATDWETVSSGKYYNNLVLKNSGLLWYFLESDYSKSFGAQVGTDSDWEFIASGFGYSMAIKTNGTLWGWGANGGRLGVGDTLDKADPTQVSPEVRYYDEGSFFSKVFNFSGSGYFGNVSWLDPVVPAGGDLSVKIRTSSSADMTGAPDWSTCDEVVNGQDLSENNCVNDADQYLQYRVDMSSNVEKTETPIFSREFFEVEYFSEDGMLTSSVYNSTAASNLLSSISWSMESYDGVSAKFQIRTAPDNGGVPGTWTDWLGPTSTNDYYTNHSGETINAAHRDGANDQYFQYKAFLSTQDSSKTPVLTEVVFGYVVNSPPEIQNLTASQNSSGLVEIAYQVRDIDTSDGTTTPGYVTPGFQYSLDNGTSWSNVTTGLSSGATENKVVEEVNYTSYNLTWDPNQQIPSNFAGQAKIKLSISDNELANSNVSAESAAFVLDTTAPIAGANPVLLNASASPAQLTFSFSDNSSFYQEVAQGTSSENCAANLGTDYSDSYNASTTLTLASETEFVCARFRDQYHNETAVQYLEVIDEVENFIVQDASNTLVDQYNLFIAWGPITEPATGFANYKVYLSTDGTNFSLEDTITDIDTNYYADFNLVQDQEYYYKITVTDDNGNVSRFSQVVHGKANGTQDAGEGGGGGSSEDETAPVISNVAVSSVYTTQVTISWETDELSDSRVEYITQTGGDFSDAPIKGVASLTNNSSGVGNHQVILSGLSPNTTYYFQVKSSDAADNVATDKDGTDGYTFTTAAGPVISSVASQQLGNTQATIVWTTDIAANSSVVYSENSDLSSSQTLTLNEESTSHSVTLTGLTAGLTYYFYVQSASSLDNNTGSYYHFVTTTDLVAPTISFNQAQDVSGVSSTGALIEWSTDEPAASTLHYGTTTEYGSTLSNANFNYDHTFQLAGLSAGTTYYFKLQSVDAEGNSAEDNNSGSGYSFQTEPANSQDTTGPTISQVAISNITEGGATVSWTTDENSNSLVEYGTTSGNFVKISGKYTDATTDHEVVLEGLSANTQYFVRVRSNDSSGNSGTAIVNQSSQELSFSTTSVVASPSPTPVAGPVISEVSVGTLTYNSAVINWKTDQTANALVDYGTTQSFGKTHGDHSSSATDHSVELPSLLPATNYYFRVRSTNGSGVSSEKSVADNQAALSFVTLNAAMDTDGDGDSDEIKDAADQLKNSVDNSEYTKEEVQEVMAETFESDLAISSSGPSAEVTENTTVTIKWNTNLDSFGKVVYWDSANDETTAVSVSEGAVAGASHEIVIKNLNAQTKYNFYVVSTGILGKEIRSEEKNFTTGDTPQISSILVKEVDLDSALISWVAESVSSNRIEYGSSTKYGSEKEAGSSSNGSENSVLLENLESGTEYHFRIVGQDADEETVSSDDYVFITTDLPEISAVELSEITAEGAVIKWKTNTKTDSLVEYSLAESQEGTSQGKLEAVLEHEIKLENLLPGTSYRYKVISTDQFGNRSETEEQRFSTKEDNNPIQISAVKSETTVYPNKDSKIQTIVSWVTDKSATTILAYRRGSGEDIPQEVLADESVEEYQDWKIKRLKNFSQNHLSVVTDFDPSTVYRFKVASVDKYGNIAVSENYSLLTPAKRKSVFDLIVKNFEDTFGWVKKMRK